MKKLIIALTGILALPVIAQSTASAPTAVVPSATTTITTVPLNEGTETTTTTTTVTGPKQAMEEAPVENTPSAGAISENPIEQSTPQRQEKAPGFNLNSEEDEYVPGSNYLRFEDKDEDEY